MKLRFCFNLALPIALALSPSRAGAETPLDWFNKAVQYDLSIDGDGTAQLAFEWYLRAAEAGMPEAEFNVAVMYDSGRGVPPNVGKAATWYARGATHGNRRAAYNLGLLYQLGQGVPQNADLARAWFAASDLPAARARLFALRTSTPSIGTLSAPILVAPAAGDDIGSRVTGTEFVWTSKAQPEAVRFYMELRALGPSDSQEVFSSFSDVSSIKVVMPGTKGDYAWRVIAVARKASRYTASLWQRFRVIHTDQAAE